MAWSRQNPGAGEPDGIRYQARLRSDKVNELRDARARLQSARQEACSAQWTGRSRNAFVSTLESAAPDLDVLITGLDATAAALNRYAAQVEQIQDAQRALEHQRDQARRTVWDRQRRLRDLASTPGMIGTGSDRAHPFEDPVTADIRAHVTDQLDSEQAILRQVDTNWDLLVTRRRQADAACVAALDSRDTLGNTWRLTGSAIRTDTPEQLLALLGALGSTDLLILLKLHPELVGKIQKADPAAVAAWWARLPSAHHDGQPDGQADANGFSAEQAAMIAGAPTLIGSLNGLPALARVAANKLNAEVFLKENTTEFNRLVTSGKIDSGTIGRLIDLAKEDAYLHKVTDGTVQLYLYDRAKAQIIEMEGTPSAATDRVVTYVPGMFSDMNLFYDRKAQEIATWLVGTHPSTAVAFIYKDGVFPGGSDGKLGALNAQFPVGLAEANSPDWAAAGGRRLAGFEAGVILDPMMADAKTIAIGHSWGLTDVTASEVAGAHYDQVISLSGAWMPEHWQADPTTHYSDFSYPDILLEAQATGIVGNGNDPRASAAFDHGSYYQSPTDPIIRGPFGVPMGLDQSILLNNHNLIATTDSNNLSALADVRDRIFG